MNQITRSDMEYVYKASCMIAGSHDLLTAQHCYS